jgi:hypothetical protein
MTRAAVSVILAFFLALASPALAQEREFDFYSRGPYAEGIPRPEQVLGYAIGARHTYHHQMEEYMAALARSTRRVKLERYAASFEGRGMWLVFISAEENITRLDAIREQVARLRDPRATPEAEARRIAASTPAIAWMNYGIDGNESAAFEAAMQVAYQVAAGEDEVTRRIRERVVTVINPAHNPDAHERFVVWYNAITAGRGGVADPAAAEHAGDWLMDANDLHYRIDPNRDAYAMTQVESQAVVRQIHRWNPQVFADHHSGPPIFFFPPVASPVNPNFGEIYARWENLYGRAIAAEFDRYGWTYMNREVYDFFFPGYFDAYPTLNGAIGMTFETDGGGRRGLRFEREDGSQATLRGAIAKHFAASLGTLRATAEHNEQRLVDFYLFRKTGMDETEREPMKQIVLLPGDDRPRFAQFLALLQQHCVEMWQARAAFTSSRARSYLDDKPVAREFPAGTVVIPLAQPQKRLIKTLLEPEAKLPDDFVKEARARRERNDSLGRGAARERYGFYDTTAWSLPLTYGIEAWWTEDRAASLARLEEPPAVTGGVEGLDPSGRANYGYIFRYDSNASAALLARLLRDGFHPLALRDKLCVSGGPAQTPTGSACAAADSFGPGSIVLRTERNPAALHARIAELARELGVAVRALPSAWTHAGINLGSSRLVDLKAPRVALAYGEPTNGRSYGNVWFLFEQFLDYPFTPIPTDALARVDLSRYDVLIFADGSESAYQDALGARGAARIKQWIENGGVFIGLKGGAAFATRRGIEWTTSRLVGREEPPAAGAAAPAGVAAAEKEVERTPGALLRAKLNLAHFLALGYGETEIVMHNSGYIFKPSREGTHAVSYARENARVSGFIWPDTESRLAGTPYLIAETPGRGQVILFADDPNFRLVWPRLTRLFLNAVFFAPSMR